MFDVYSPSYQMKSVTALRIVPRQTIQPKIHVASALTWNQLVAKRLVDIFLTTVGLVAILPMFAIIAIAIWLEDNGPVLFKQQRVGLNGRLFTIYKFRTMVVNAQDLNDTIARIDEDGNKIYKVKDDPRVTRIGKFLRKTSLDELPQLFNVLKGDMSLVGPRPELPELVAELYKPEQHRRFSVPQGISGWWQVNGRSDTPLHLNTDKDVYYIENYSLWLDIKIIAKTIPALLKQKGAF